MKRIAIRADASIKIGVGHIMRCLTLAQKLSSVLQRNEVSIYFICNQLPKYLKANILKEKFYFLEIGDVIDGKDWDQLFDAEQCIKLISKLGKFDIMISDHYQLDALWQDKLKPYYSKLLVIDDLANRPHHADFLLDQTVNREQLDYSPYVDKQCKLLMGQSYILLRDEFKALIPKAIIKRNRNIDLTNILISFGGTDVKRSSKIVIDRFIELHEELGIAFNYKIDVVLGSASEQLDIIKNLTESFPWITLHVDSNEMGKLILNADLAIGASGTSAWERCCLGLPTISFELANNQKLISQELETLGAIINLGKPQHLSYSLIIKNVIKLSSDNKAYANMINNCFNVCDADGAERVINEMIGSN
jgi:UDP-2,4-diacetamido-2,4,6-trideoxy-beta-L-altropyranose hydrolase